MSKQKRVAPGVPIDDYFARQMEDPEFAREYAAAQQPETCKVCGAELVWIDCQMCGGDGEYDETETDPLEGDPLATCPECGGEGGYLECPDLPHAKDESV